MRRTSPLGPERAKQTKSGRRAPTHHRVRGGESRARDSSPRGVVLGPRVTARDRFGLPRQATLLPRSPRRDVEPHGDTPEATILAGSGPTRYTRDCERATESSSSLSRSAYALRSIPGSPSRCSNHLVVDASIQRSIEARYSPYASSREADRACRHDQRVKGLRSESTVPGPTSLARDRSC